MTHSSDANPTGHHLTRRTFLAASSSLALSGCGFLPALRPAPVHRILVVGAGLAGLSCALDLRRARQDVTVLEAMDRSGGRVLTVGQFFHHQHAEGGASHFCESDLAVSAWVDELGLPTFSSPRTMSIWHDGQFTLLGESDAVRDGWRAWFRLPESLSDLPAGHLDTMSMLDLLALDGLSDEAVAFVRQVAEPILTAPIERVSALHAARMALRWREPAFELRGGAQSLVDAMTQRLEGRIQHGKAVLSIEHRPEAVSVTTHTGERLFAHHLVIAAPPPALAKIEFDPPLSPERRSAVEAIGMGGLHISLLQFRSRPWLNGADLGKTVVTDLPLQHIHRATADQLGERGILAIHTAGEEAVRLSVMDERSRHWRALDQMEAIWPGLSAEFDLGAAVDWTDHPWTGGARSIWEPRQLLDIQPLLARPLGRIHFAGEHTEPNPGTMNAALYSGRRTAQEVLDAIAVGG